MSDLVEVQRGVVAQGADGGQLHQALVPTAAHRQVLFESAAQSIEPGRPHSQAGHTVRQAADPGRAQSQAGSRSRQAAEKRHRLRMEEGKWSIINKMLTRTEVRRR